MPAVCEPALVPPAASLGAMAMDGCTSRSSTVHPATMLDSIPSSPSPMRRADLVRANDRRNPTSIPTIGAQ
jgi:hypothetical protein